MPVFVLIAELDGQGDRLVKLIDSAVASSESPHHQELRSFF